MLKFQPSHKSVLMCDFSDFKAPEMTKVRPVIVLRKNRYNSKLVTIVPISTTEPVPLIEAIHVPIDGPLDGRAAWVKCDMVTTVCIERLDRIKVKHQGKTEWITQQIEQRTFDEIQKAVASYLGL